jgi:predicted nucleic acid-binding Zn ribbon protein
MTDSGESRDPIPLAASLDAYVRSLGAPSARAIAGVFEAWDDIVGISVSAHARPTKLERSCLIVEVDDPGWATQLRYLEKDLLTRLATAVPEPIEQIEFRVRGRGRKPGRDGHNR